MYTKHTQSYRWLPWLIWIIASLFLFYDYVQQMVPASIQPALMQQFKISAATFGTIAAIYYYTYGIMQIPIGLALDHWGAHKPMTAAVLIAALGSFWFAFAGSVHSLEWSRALVGAFTGFSFVSILKLVSNWFSPALFSTLTGLTNLIGNLGAVAGETPVSAGVQIVGWRVTVAIIAAVGIVLGLLFALIIRDAPKNRQLWHEKGGNQRGWAKSFKDVKHVLGRGQLWLAGIYAAIMNTSFTVFGAAWGKDFVEKIYQATPVDASIGVDLLFIGGIPGSFLLGWFSDRIKRRKLPMYIGVIGALICLALLIYVPAFPEWLGFVLMFSLGFFCSSLVVAFALGHDLRPPGSAGISLGFLNAWCMGASAFASPFIGKILDALEGPEQVRKGVSALTVSDFQIALSTVVGILIIGLVLLFFTRETYCKSIYENE